MSDDGAFARDLGGFSSYTTSPARALELFEQARRRCPVARSDVGDGFHLLLDYDDVKAGLADHGTFSSEPMAFRPVLPRPPIPALDMDPPVHGLWRVLFNQAVTPRAVHRVEPWVRAAVDRHIDGFIGRGSCDLVAELAGTVPAETICNLLGLDDHLVDRVCGLAMDMIAALGEPVRYEEAAAAFAAVAVAEIRSRQAAPRDDYLSLLATATVDGRPLGDGEYVGLLLALFGAGHHSTTSAMTTLIHEVYTRPGLREELTAYPDRIPAAVEESLRLHPPFYGFYRRATRPVTVAGVDIAEGGDVYLAWAAANRDPRMFDDPTSYRMDRRPNRHLSFGFGIHFCPGAPLARMELRVLLEQLLARIPDLTIALDELTYQFGGADYAFAPALPASFTPRRPAHSEVG